MTRDELRDKIDTFDAAGMVKEPAIAALRAVVELHKPREAVWWISNPNLQACSVCIEETWDGSEPLAYPCPTIRAIEKELSA